jgi:hypothetical protein
LPPHPLLLLSPHAPPLPSSSQWRLGTENLSFRNKIVSLRDQLEKDKQDALELHAQVSFRALETKVNNLPISPTLLIFISESAEDYLSD